MSGHEFALDGEQIWMVTAKGVVHWDGRQWLNDRTVTPAQGESMVAGGGEVWIVDSMGKLWHYDGRHWESRTLTLPGVKWGNEPDEENPKLARTTDGAVWLMRQGPLACGTERLGLVSPKARTICRIPN